MFDIQFSTSDPGVEASESSFFDETAEDVRNWLAALPSRGWLANADAGLVLTHLPAFELALAAYVKNHDAEFLELTAKSVERLNASAQPRELTNEILAGLIGLNLHLFQLLRETHFEGAARHWIEAAIERWEDELNFFRVSAADAGQVFWTAPNAKLGEAFYLAWRVLDDETLRTKAGEILGHVSGLFDADMGLYQHAELPDGLRSVTNQPGAYSSAMQMFLTASETTGRRTYMARACMIAEYALDKLDIENAPTEEQAALADALVRLGQFSGVLRYGERARSLLQDAMSHVAAERGHASLALAVEHSAHFPLHIVIIGDVENDESARRLWLAALNEYASTRAIEVLHPTKHARRIQQLGYSASDKSPFAYICSGMFCLPPVSSIEGMGKAMAHIRVPAALN